MKKLLLFGIIICILASCGGSSKKVDPKTSPDRAAIATGFNERISLNGVSYDTANEMIKKFQDPNSSWTYSSPTTYWFGKDKVYIIDSLLHAENADGVRIYLARDSVKSINTFLLVSTRDDGVTGGQHIHGDYFNHSANLLKKGYDEDGNDGGGATLIKLAKCDDTNCELNRAYHITCDSAISWVQNTKSNDKIKTKADWFDICVWDYITDELKKAPSSDGIRIYLSESKKDKWHKMIIATTKPLGANYHQDYYECHATSNCAVPLTENGELCPTHCQGTTVPQN